MEITERFPPALGNLAQHARFPHSHSRFLLLALRKRHGTRRAPENGRRDAATIVDSDRTSRARYSALRRGNKSGGKGFEKPGSHPSEYRQPTQFSQCFDHGTEISHELGCAFFRVLTRGHIVCSGGLTRPLTRGTRVHDTTAQRRRREPAPVPTGAAACYASRRSTPDSLRAASTRRRQTCPRRQPHERGPNVGRGAPNELSTINARGGVTERHSDAAGAC